MRRRAAVLIMVALAGAMPAQAQQGQWLLGFRLERTGFAGGARDTVSFPGDELELRPQGRLVYGVGLGYQRGPWEGSLRASYAGGHVLLKGSAAAIEDRTVGMHRLELALLLSRRLAYLGSARLVATAGPALDHWFGDLVEDQTRLAAQLGLGLRVPLRGIQVENSIVAGWSTSPFSSGDITPPAERRRLLSLTIGMGVQFGL